MTERKAIPQLSAMEELVVLGQKHHVRAVEFYNMVGDIDAQIAQEEGLSGTGLPTDEQVAKIIQRQGTQLEYQRRLRRSALDHYSRAGEAYRELAEDNPEHGRWWSWAAITLRELAACLNLAIGLGLDPQAYLEAVHLWTEVMEQRAEKDRRGSLPILPDDVLALARLLTEPIGTDGEGKWILWVTPKVCLRPRGDGWIVAEMSDEGRGPFPRGGGKTVLATLRRLVADQDHRAPVYWASEGLAVRHILGVLEGDNEE